MFIIEFECEARRTKAFKSIKSAWEKLSEEFEKNELDEFSETLSVEEPLREMINSFLHNDEMTFLKAYVYQKKFNIAISCYDYDSVYLLIDYFKKTIIKDFCIVAYHPDACDEDTGFDVRDRYICENGHVRHEEFYPQLEGEVYSSDEFDLAKAAQEGNLTVVKSLIEKGVSPCVVVWGYTAYFHAIKNGYTDIVECFIKHGVDVNAEQIDISGVKVNGLEVAIKNSQIKVAKILCKNKINVNYICSDGDSVLGYALFIGKFKIANILIRNRADVNFVSKFGTPVAYFAIKSFEIVREYSESIKDRNEVFDLMIKNGLDCNMLVNKGRGDIFTYLMDAASYGDISIIKILLKENVDVNVVNKNRKLTALDCVINSEYADEEEFKEIYCMLRDGGAKTYEELKAEGKVKNKTTRFKRKADSSA
ncbi:ankyrin repeat domain-containing protein [Zooshikella harenae]|uniref:Ankyrin repeat domain-containing protein n=1 Tax=Zooshikella harenae TaxID=2827238 RepID=A0ABS5ZK46_9GAMM|nr:ankyrin repeat domain-containing protein [Zooshikella harenae]MBU2714310.1 ankyrin repeat domain-containing protein [Zooshikella harenae]